MPKPFHESIIPIIEKADMRDLGLIGGIIIATKIPKGHDAMIAAWQKKTCRSDASKRVTASLLAQKAELAADNDDIEEARADELCEVRGD